MALAYLALGDLGEDVWMFVFGPGVGESVVVRWPPDHWLVMDSFQKASRPVPIHPALELLVSYGVQVDAVVLTHPHRDHTGGLQALVDLRKAEGVVGWWPSMNGEVRWDTPNAGEAAKQGETEDAMAAIERAWSDSPGSKWEMSAESPDRLIGGATLRVLSPLAASIDHVRALKSQNMNEISTSLLFSWGGCSLVLGGDLVNRRGWTDLAEIHGLNAFAGTSGVKIAHHGSFEAQHVVVLGNPPPSDRVFMGAPYASGGKVPDYEDGGDVDHLLKVANRLLMSAHHGTLPAGSDTTDLPRTLLKPAVSAMGSLNFLPSAPSPDPRECWVAARWTDSGELVGTYRGAGSLQVVAG